MALGSLDAVTTHLPDPGLFIYSYIRREAQLSSEIEGTQSSLSDLLEFELEQTPGALIDDVTEVSNYVSALDYGLRRMRDENFPLSNRLIRELHGILLKSGRGSQKQPGEFRTSQNWIGGTRPGTALYVPPPHHEVQNCMGMLEQFMHHTDDGLPALVRAGLVHAQFETIHPFLDGNGRVGRMLIPFILVNAKALKEPILYLSLYLKQYRNMYYDLLNQLRHEGDWESWLEFFLEGVELTANHGVQTAQRLNSLFEQDRKRIEEGSQVNSTSRVHHEFTQRPLSSVTAVSKRIQVAYATANSAVQNLVDMGIVQEVTGRRRERVFVYSGYLGVLNEELDPFSGE